MKKTKGNPNPSPSTRFKPGYAGNPNGSGKRQWMEKVLAGRQGDILEKATQLALEGNPKMIELLMSRALPPAPMDEAVKLKLKGKSFKEQGDIVLESMGEGLITPREAFAVSSNIQANINTDYATDIIDMITKLESRK